MGVVVVVGVAERTQREVAAAFYLNTINNKLTREEIYRNKLKANK